MPPQEFGAHGWGSYSQSGGCRCLFCDKTIMQPYLERGTSPSNMHGWESSVRSGEALCRAADNAQKRMAETARINRAVADELRGMRPVFKTRIRVNSDALFAAVMTGWGAFLVSGGPGVALFIIAWWMMFQAFWCESVER